VEIAILEEDYSSKWASPFSTSLIPKKNFKIRVFTDFRKLNLLMERHQFPIITIGDMGIEENLEKLKNSILSE
jgi:hypothetical protein